jgi:lysophospholipase
MTDGVRHETGTFAAPDGLQLTWQSWTPDDGPVAVLAVVHGYGEHGGRYGFLVDAMTARGLAVWTYDLRGHGRSPGRRGHIDRFTDYLADTRAFLAHLRRKWPQEPLLLLGHSMGGLIAAAYVEQTASGPDGSGSTASHGSGLTGPNADDDGLAGLIMSSPFVGVRLPVSPLKAGAARVLSRVAPTMRMANPLRNEQLSHDPEVVAAAAADPLNHRVTTTRWAAEVLDAQPAVIAAAGRLRLPFLLMYADDDPIADPSAAERLFDRVASSDKTKLSYEGFYHEIFNEVGRAVVFADLAAWVQERVTPSR